MLHTAIFIPCVSNRFYTKKYGGMKRTDVECSELPTTLMANLLIYRVSSSTDLNHKCSIGEMNLFLFFYEMF